MPDALAGPKVRTTREKNNTTASGTIYDVTYWLTWFNQTPSERNSLKSPRRIKTRKKNGQKKRAFAKWYAKNKTSRTSKTGIDKELRHLREDSRLHRKKNES